MKSRHTLLLVAALFIGFVPGCSSGETTVIEPQTYEMTEQEKANKEREEKMLAEQQQ